MPGSAGRSSAAKFPARSHRHPVACSAPVAPLRWPNAPRPFRPCVKSAPATSRHVSAMTLHSDTVAAAPRVLVIGGRGFVGSHIVRALVARGIAVHVFGPPMATDLLADLSGRFDETAGSVEDRAAIIDVLRASGATAVVTTAAFGEGQKGLMQGGEADADRAMAINVDGLRHVLEAAH